MPDVNDFSNDKITKKTRYMKINNNGVTTADLKARAVTNPPGGREAKGNRGRKGNEGEGDYISSWEERVSFLEGRTWLTCSSMGSKLE